METRELSKYIADYWEELIQYTGVTDSALRVSVPVKSWLMLDAAVNTLTEDEVEHIVQDDNESLKFYYMSKVWNRYIDLLLGRSEVKEGYYCITGDSSVHELQVTLESLNKLKSKGVRRICEVAEGLDGLDYPSLLNITSALSTLNWRIPCLL